ncbi:MAG TPA: S41 family peptidase [bacterium]|nr:S41 family peptidase [bacterium]
MDRLLILFVLLSMMFPVCVACGDDDDDDDNDNIDDDDAIDDDDTADDDASVDDDAMDDDSSDDDATDDDTTDDDTVDDDTGDDDTGDDDTDPAGPYYQDFLRYWQTMDEGYAYFTLKEIDWNAAYDTYAPLAYEIDQPGEFSLLIAEMTASLHDSHTWSYLSGVPLEDLPYRMATDVCLMRVGERVYVSRLTAAAEAAGMRLGDEVTALDGEDVDDVLARAGSWEGCSSSQCCDFYNLAHVDRFSAGEETVTYTVEQETAAVDIELDRDGTLYSTCKPQPMVDFLADASGTVLRYKPIDDDLGYIHLSTLSEGYIDTITAELDAALASFAGRGGIVFDARFNRGGSDLTVMQVLARFLDQIVWPVAVRYKNGPGHDDFTPWVPEPIFAGAAPTDVDVVFLINGGCISAADFFAASASYVPTFTLLGTTSCGATGAPKNDTLPDSGITYYYSQMQRKFLATGEQIEGMGIEPDIVVEQDAADLAAGVDTQLEAAIALLRARE